MAKVCPITKTIVLYADCLDCDWKDECKKPRQKSNDKSNDKSEVSSWKVDG